MACQRPRQRLGSSHSGTYGLPEPLYASEGGTENLVGLAPKGQNKSPVQGGGCWQLAAVGSGNRRQAAPNSPKQLQINTAGRANPYRPRPKLQTHSAFSTPDPRPPPQAAAPVPVSGPVLAQSTVHSPHSRIPSHSSLPLPPSYSNYAPPPGTQTPKSQTKPRKHRRLLTFTHLSPSLLVPSSSPSVSLLPLHPKTTSPVTMTTEVSPSSPSSIPPPLLSVAPSSPRPLVSLRLCPFPQPSQPSLPSPARTTEYRTVQHNPSADCPNADIPSPWRQRLWPRPALFESALRLCVFRLFAPLWPRSQTLLNLC